MTVAAEADCRSHLFSRELPFEPTVAVTGAWNEVMFGC